MLREKIEHHIKHLQEKHEELDKRIALDKEPEYILTVLKKEKLQLKDEIARFKNKLQWNYAYWVTHTSVLEVIR